MHFILLQNYNNYYNRTYRREDTVQGYKDAVVAYNEELTKSVNFNINDGINMQHVFNGTFSGEPNYMLMLNETDDSIHSRWFVVEWRKVRGSQYEATLRRDLLADNYEAITTAPSFIEKGYVSNTDPAIFNKEEMTFNQIKKSEVLLKDDSKTAWIVGFIAKDATLGQKTFSLGSPQTDITEYSSQSHTNWDYASICDGTRKTTLNYESSENRMRFILRWEQNFAEWRYEFMFNRTLGSAYRIYPHQALDYWNVENTGIWDYINGNWRSQINWDTCGDKVILDNSSWISKADYDYLKSIVGKNIQFSDGIYQLELVGEYDELQGDWQYYQNGELYNYLYSIVNANVTGGITGSYRWPVAYKLMQRKFTFVLNKVEDVEGTYSYEMKDSTKPLTDAPYKMFAIPYYKEGDEQYTFSLDGTNFINCDASIMMAWAWSIAEELGGGGQDSKFIDLQILPYCPLSYWRGRISRPGVWSVGKTVNEDYMLLKTTVNNTEVTVGVCSFCDVSTKEQTLSEAAYKTTVLDYKISNETDFLRICSPNYASVFEFSAAKNGGVEGYNVRYTYKPFQPFINVAPIFSNLYGQDFKDNRGLICAGDFSLPVVSSAWINYQLSNKNYQLAFDRQVENMEVQYKWQKAQSIVNASVGTLQGGTTGAMMGGMAGGPWGAVAGGVIGTAGSLAGGIADVVMQESLHNEAIDFAKDNFGYQLGNIKALPTTLNKVSSIVANSKFFPFVEKYSCTEEEKKALEDKIKYNGMSIGRIGQILDFLNPSDTTYVKGQIIRLEGNFDTHTLNEIANEFMKGWYI